MKKLVLAAGAVMLVSMRLVADGTKVQLDFQEGIQVNDRINVLAFLNKGDDRFKFGPSQRHGWITAEKGQLKEFGITQKQIDALVDGDVELNISNPFIKIDGVEINLVLQLTDSFEGTEYQQANPETTAKQYIGKDDITKYFTKSGKLIFQNSTIVAEKDRKHNIIESDAQVTWEQYNDSIELSTVQSTKAEPALNG